MFWIGCAAFIFFTLSDCNDLWLRKKALSFCFPAGAVLLSLSVVWQCFAGASPVASLALRLMFFALAVLFAALLIYTLFFALPAKASYALPGRKRAVRDRGVYALCRHPGLLWQGFMCLCLWLACGLPFISVACYTALNLALVCFEDFLVFPALLEGYDRYKAAAPMLIPKPASLRRCLRYYANPESGGE